MASKEHENFISVVIFCYFCYIPEALEVWILDFPARPIKSEGTAETFQK